MGRSAELAELDRLLATALGGGSGRLLVVGDPGIGKTALLEEVAASCRRRHVGVMQIRGGDIDAAAEQIGHREGAVPVVLLVDDLDDMDAGALATLSDLTQMLAETPSLVVLAARPHNRIVEAFATWTLMLLAGLSTDCSIALLREELGTTSDAALPYRLAERLDGNPLALRQVPRMLTPDQRSGHAPLPAQLPVPPALDHAWGRILDALPPGARAAALDLAVVGPRPDLLARMGEDAAWTQADLAEVVGAGLAAPSARVSPDFVHSVVRDVVLEHASPALVQRRHAAAGDFAAALEAPPRVVAHHLVHSTAMADEAVAAALEEQARRAQAQDQLSLASDCWQASARMSTSVPTRVTRALSALDLVISNGLDYSSVDDLLSLLSGEEMEGECALWVEWLYSLQRSEADPESALTAQWSTIRRARTAAPGTLRELLWDAAMNAWSLGETDAALQAAEEFVEVERSVGEDSDGVEPPWTGIALKAAGLFQAGDVAAAMDLRARAITAAATVDPLAVSFDRLLSIVFLDDLLLDTSPEAGDRVLVACQRAEEGSAPLACIDGIRAWRARAAGDWSRAIDILGTARALAARTGAIGPQLGMAALAAEMAGLQGRDADLHQEATALRAQAMRVGDRRRLATLDHAIGLRALAAGEFDEAILALGAAADVPFLGRGLRDAVLPARVDLVETFARMGDLAAARQRADAVGPLLAAMGDPLARGLELRVRALVSSGAEAEAALRASLAAHLAARDPFETARAQLMLGEHLRRGRQRSEARGALLAAERGFETLGAAPWLARARGELRASGGRPPSVAGLEVLTAQERAVAEAVAAGRSNREAAQTLYLSPRTVEYHLSNIYRKLGIQGRGALVRRLADAGGPRN